MILRIKHNIKNIERVIDEMVYNDLKEKGFLEGYKIIERIPEKKITVDVPEAIKDRIVKRKSDAVDEVEKNEN